MRLVVLASLALLGQPAAAAPAYPIVLVKADVAQREAAFRAANPQRWISVDIDELGFIRSASTDDPTLAAGDPAVIRELARKNAAFFHMDPAMADRLTVSPGMLEIVDVVGNNVAGEIVFHPTGKLLTIDGISFVAVGRQQVTGAEVVKRIAGKPYAATITFGTPPPRDCGMTPAGPAGCQSHIERTEHGRFVAEAKDVTVETVLYRQGNTLRLVHCADVTARLPDSVLGRVLAPAKGSPALPLVLDAVTGQELATGATTCTVIRNYR